MKKHDHSFKMRKIYAVALLLVTIYSLALLNTNEFFLLLVPLYLESLILSYAIQAENSKERIDMKAVFGFSIAIALASLMAYGALNIVINGL